MRWKCKHITPCWSVCCRQLSERLTCLIHLLFTEFLLSVFMVNSQSFVLDKWDRTFDIKWRVVLCIKKIKWLWFSEKNNILIFSRKNKIILYFSENNKKFFKSSENTGPYLHLQHVRKYEVIVQSTKKSFDLSWRGN